MLKPRVYWDEPMITVCNHCGYPKMTYLVVLQDNPITTTETIGHYCSDCANEYVKGLS